MHTHFGSGTMVAAVFLPLLLIGTVWKLAWSHALIWGARHNSPHVVGLSRAALYQYN